MSQQYAGTRAIVIPTGRGGCCCIIPLALMFAAGGLGAIALLVVLRRVRRGARRM